MTDEETLPDLYHIWNYSAPAETRKRFEQILTQAKQSNGHESYVLQLQTQIARTYSIEGTFDRAHAILDEVESKLTGDLPLVKIRYLLERGRTFNSAGDKLQAEVLFNEAYTLSRQHNEDFHAVDAAHMVAIATSDVTDKERWNLTGVKIAEESNDERARSWLGSLYNNIGWDYFAKERYQEAALNFEKALEYQIALGEGQGKNLERINIARWCVAKGYRLVGRIDEALAIQKKLLSAYEQSGESDGYVFEELGELFLLQGEAANSQKYFAEAYRELSKDSWLVKNEFKRMERLRALGLGEDGSKK